MFGTIIEKLSSLLSKGAFLSGFIPLLFFVLLNGALLSAANPPFRDWILERRTDAEFLFGALIAFLIGTLLFVTVNTRLREVMEGRFWPRSFSGVFTEAEQRRLQSLNDEYSSFQRNRRTLDREGDKWKERLRSARMSGAKRLKCAYDFEGQTARRVDVLRKARLRGDPILAQDLSELVPMLEIELRDNPIQGRNGPDARLDDDHVELCALIDYARAKTRHEIIRIFNERQFNFPDQVLAPTEMGNIALSIRSYALSRYQFNVESFWTRLQKVMQGEAFYQVLQDSKLQLDFLVSMFWLNVVFTTAWLTALVVLGYSLPLYMAIALAGPLSLWALYRLAIQNYRAFADLMRSAIDTYRLRLLRDLQLPVPTGSREEAAVWDALQDRMDYGKDFNLSYRRSE